MRIIKISILCSIIFVFSSCSFDSKNEVKNNDAKITEAETEEAKVELFTILNPMESGIKFVNELTESATMNGLYYEYYYNGSGVSVADINNDGLKDILFISSLRKNKLYLNQGGLKFKDISEDSGLHNSKGFRTGVTNVDINNDGLMDFYICKSGQYDNPEKRKNELWVNLGPNQTGNPEFVEKASDYQLDITMCSTQSAFFDYDRDGDLDMFLINHYTTPPKYNEIDNLIRSKSELTGDRLYKNIDGKFIDVTYESGISNISRLSYGLGLSIGDINNDGWPDIYVANDYEGKDFLYLNNGDGTFTDIANEATNHVSYYSMGTDMADINNDGWIDFMSLDMMAVDNYTIKTSMSSMNPDKFQNVVDKGLHYQYMYNALQINNGVNVNSGLPLFSDIAQLSNVASTDWSWGPLFMDIDNDGFTDLFVSNGIKKDFRNNDFVNKQKKRKDIVKAEDRENFIMGVLDEMPSRKKQNFFFKNNGDLSFSNKSSEWVPDIPSSSNGATYGDLDNDGDLEIIVNNADDVSLIYKNKARELLKGNYLSVEFKGASENVHGIGARVKIWYNNQIQIKEHYLTRGFQSAVPTGLHFGLGRAKEIDSLEIIWPDGKQQKMFDVEVNNQLVLNYTVSKTKKRIQKTEQLNRFTEIENSILGINWSHSENPFNDFQREVLLPHKMSQMGPATAVGDYNGDGLDDIYYGGAFGQSSMLYAQMPTGEFKAEQSQVFDVQKNYEDTDAIFFDADGDKDLDLYVVSGGNEKDFNFNNYVDHLYENINGRFVLAESSLPKFTSSGACVRTIDFDNDGDLDLFIGGRQTPGKYPLPSNSMLLRNDSTEERVIFNDVTESIFPSLKNFGMVTDALIIDLNNDHLNDIIIVGEWMPIRVFYNVENQFVEKTIESGFENTVGWWNTVKSADFDKDGDLDIIVGNLGLNYKYKATLEKPFKIYADDFDQTGTLDIVLGFYEGSDLYPLRGRQCSSQQMPFIKEKFKNYDEFGKASLIDVYGEDNLNSSVSYEAQTFASTYFNNNGDGTFSQSKLANMAQISSINDIVIRDFDQDGNLDFVAAGNLYNSEVETPRNDASIGIFMKGNGKGQFDPISMTKSGLSVSGEVRSMHKLKLASGNFILMFSRNNNSPVFFKVLEE